MAAATGHLATFHACWLAECDAEEGHLCPGVAISGISAERTAWQACFHASMVDSDGKFVGDLIGDRSQHVHRWRTTTSRMASTMDDYEGQLSGATIHVTEHPYSRRSPIPGENMLDAEFLAPPVICRQSVSHSWQATHPLGNAAYLRMARNGRWVPRDAQARRAWPGALETT
ncbi:MAG: hypothetical protein PBU97_21685 [Stenotrophomonas maltophilia]